jgi:hypothetical protein
LIKKVCNPLRNLEPFKASPIIFQIDPEALKFRSLQERRQALHNLPGHHAGVIRGILRGFRKDIFKYLVDERIGKGEITVRADSMVPGEFHGQPSLHTQTLNDNGFRFQGGREGRSQDFGQGLGQYFQSVAGKEF